MCTVYTHNYVNKLILDAINRLTALIFSVFNNDDDDDNNNNKRYWSLFLGL